MSDFITLPAITLVTYLIGLFIKTLGTSETLDRCIPAICGASGGVIALIVYFTNPEYIATENWLTAIAIGIASGFAATALNQLYKQFSK